MTGRWIICEKTGTWAAALRWAAGPDGLRIYETRSLEHCREELAQFPCSFLSLEATVLNLESVVELLDEVRQSFVEARAMVLAQPDLSFAQDILREAGAVDMVFSPRRLDLTVRQAQKHLAAVAQPQLGLRETIWSRLPWGEK